MGLPSETKEARGDVGGEALDQYDPDDRPELSSPIGRTGISRYNDSNVLRNLMRRMDSTRGVCGVHERHRNPNMYDAVQQAQVSPFRLGRGAWRKDKEIYLYRTTALGLRT